MLEMEKTSVTPGIRIILTENNASYSNKELRAIISALNKSLYKIAKSHDGTSSERHCPTEKVMYKQAPSKTDRAAGR